MEFESELTTYLKFQIYKNRVFNHSLGHDFYQTVKYLKDNIEATFGKAVHEIRNNELGKFIKMNRDDNVQLVFKIMDYIFIDDVYKNILERFSQLFEISSITETKTLLDNYSDISDEFKDLKISDKLEAIATEYRDYVELRKMIHSKFLEYCSEHNIVYNGTEQTLVQHLSESNHMKLIKCLAPKSLLIKLSDSKPIQFDIESNCTTFSTPLLKMLMIISCLSVHGSEHDIDTCEVSTMEQSLPVATIT